MIINHDCVQGLHTLYHKLPDGKLLAAIMMPSKCEYKYSASKVKVTSYGKIIMSKDCAFIKPPTVEESSDKDIRAMMDANYRYLKSLTNDCRFSVLTNWMHDVLENDEVSVVRLFYGGDVYWLYSKDINLLQELSCMVQLASDRDFTLLLRTADIEHADKEYCTLNSKGALDRRIKVVAETQGFGDMPLFIPDRVRYHWHHEQCDGAVEDLDALPIDTTDSLRAMFNREVQISLPENAYEYFTEV